MGWAVEETDLPVYQKEIEVVANKSYFQESCGFRPSSRKMLELTTSQEAELVVFF